MRPGLMAAMSVLTLLIVTLSTVISMSSCQPHRPSADPKERIGDYSLILLFEHDGVKVYRFRDCGDMIYYTDARGKVSWEESRGEDPPIKHSVETTTK